MPDENPPIIGAPFSSGGFPIYLPDPDFLHRKFPEKSPEGWEIELSLINKLLLEHKNQLALELGAPFQVLDFQPGRVREIRGIHLGPFEFPDYPTLRLNRELERLELDGRDMDQVKQCFSFFRSLWFLEDGVLQASPCQTNEEALERIEKELRTSYPAFEHRDLNLSTLLGKYRDQILEAKDPFPEICRLLAKLGDAHTFIKKLPGNHELPYRVHATKARLSFSYIPEDSKAYQLGAREGDELLEPVPGDLFERVAASNHLKPYLVGRRLLSAPPGENLLLKIRKRNGEILEFTEAVSAYPHPPFIEFERIDSIPYIKLNTFYKESGFHDSLIEAMKEFYKEPVLILDLRLNGGGNLILAQEFRRRFLRKDTLCGFLRYSLPCGGLGEKEEIIASPAKSKDLFAGQLIVLTSPLSYSASEDFLLGLQGLEHVTVIGEQSGGGCGRMRLIPLFEDALLTISTCLGYDRNDHCVEGAGIPVDIQVPFPANGQCRDHRKKVLQTAVDYARQLMESPAKI